MEASRPFVVASPVRERTFAVSGSMPYAGDVVTDTGETFHFDEAGEWMSPPHPWGSNSV